MTFILFFISFISTNTLFHASSPDTSAPQATHSTAKTSVFYDQIAAVHEGMGDRQNAKSNLFEEYPDEISIWKQIIAAFLLMLHSFLNFLTGEY